VSVKVLHTSDWHLGCMVRGESRVQDHDAVIAEITAIAREFEPDLVLHTGDLFNGSRPGHEDLLRALRAVRNLSEIAPVLVLAGNHDAPSCFELLAEAVGAPPPQNDWDPYAICELPIRFLPKPCTATRGAVATYGSASGTPVRVGCLPFLHANRVVEGLEEITDFSATYTDKVNRITQAISEVVFAPADYGSTVAVWASHLHVDGVRTSSERQIHIDSNYATDASHIHAGYSYLAFGHIHMPQEVPGGRGRYAGSPIEIDFGEEGEAKGVVLVTAEPATRARVEVRPLTSGRRIRRLRGTLEQLDQMAAEIGRDICVVTVDDAPDDVESLNRAARDALPDACVVQVIDGRSPVAVSIDDLADDGEPRSEESLGTAYRRYLEEELSTRPQTDAEPQRIAELFDELLASVEAIDEPDPREAAELARLETAELVPPNEVA